MVCVRVSIEDPFQGEMMGLDMPQQSIGGCRSCRTRSWIKIKDRIDDSRSSCDWVGDNTGRYQLLPRRIQSQRVPHLCQPVSLVMPMSGQLSWSSQSGYSRSSFASTFRHEHYDQCSGSEARRLYSTYKVRNASRDLFACLNHAAAA